MSKPFTEDSLDTLLGPVHPASPTLQHGDADVINIVVGSNFNYRSAYNLRKSEEVDGVIVYGIETAQLRSHALMLLAACSGMAAGESVKLAGIGSARILPDGGRFLRVYI